MNLNIMNWKTIYLKDIYDIQMGNGFDKDKMDKEIPEVNFISRQSHNNGVDIKVSAIDGVEPFKSGNLTVALGGAIGSCFVQEEPFYTAQNIAVCTPKYEKMTKNVNIFISALIKYESSIKYYAFGRELNTHIRTDFTIKLPIDSQGNPDWQFMDDYIKSLHYKALTTKNKRNNTLSLDEREWKEFSISALFDICAGNYYSKDDFEEGSIPYVSASNTNNGIGSTINKIPDFTENKITIGKVGATAYYQSERFCATSDVNVLTPKFNMNKYSGLFITTIINMSENCKWSYGRQCRVGDTRKIKIRLPIDSQGNPDWQFMEDYIKSLPYGDRLEG